jgi:hypothetical protein
MFCKNCGNKFQEDEKFCGKCGHPVIVASTEVKTSNENLTTEAVVNKNQNLKGLGGWLILVLLGLAYMGYSYGSLALQSIKYFTDGTVENASMIQGYAGALGFEIVMQIILFIFILYLLFLFIKKNNKFTKFFIIFAIANIIFIALDTYILAFALNYPTEEIKQSMQGAISDGWTQLSRAVVYAVVWIWYMRVSKRVKLTFIEK